MQLIIKEYMNRHYYHALGICLQVCILVYYLKNTGHHPQITDFQMRLNY